MNVSINDTFQDTLIKVIQIFDFINQEMFQSELPEILITIESDKKKGKVSGWYQSKTYWKHENESLAQINIKVKKKTGKWNNV